jgi:hypothetical protein
MTSVKYALLRTHKSVPLIISSVHVCIMPPLPPVLLLVTLYRKEVHVI